MTIVAEIGTAHNGSLEKAKKLIDLAKNAGADAVKFQWVYADEILHPDTGYVKLPGGNIRLYDSFKKLECNKNFYKKCLDYAHSQNLLFYCSPFGLKSLKELISIKPDAVKIASPEVNHIPLLKEIAKTCSKIKVIISSGVSKLCDLENAISILSPIKDLTLLHCITSYPAPEEEYNVKCIETLRNIFGIKTGLSDHSRDAILVPVLSVVFGSVMIEKHITISNDTDGLDDKVALTGEQFAHMVHCVHQSQAVLNRYSKDQIFTPIKTDSDEQKNFGQGQILSLGQCEILRQLSQQYDTDKIKAVIGSGIKKLALSEKENYGKTNRSLHYMKDLKKGHVLKAEDIGVLRTEKVLSAGISPAFLETAEGAVLQQNVSSGQGVQFIHLIKHEDFHKM